MKELFSDVVYAYVNGDFVAPEAAKISPFDRGMVFGDGIYEVVPVYGGRAFRWEEHLERLNRNLEIVGIRVPMSNEQWTGVFDRLMSRAADANHYLYLQVTRGVAPRNHVFPDAIEPTVFAFVQKLAPVSSDLLEVGARAVTVTDFRWHRCDIKTTSLIANAWLRQQAKEQGAVEALLVRDGVVTEGAATNVFAVIDGVVRTAPQGPQILPGITRDLVIELMLQAGIRCEERTFTKAEMAQATEVWITSSTNEVMPVTRIDNAKVSDARPGPVFQRVHELFQQFKAEYCTDARRDVG